MNINKIKEAAENAKIGSIHNVQELSNGYASQSYLITSDQGTFVALTQKENAISAPNYTYYYSILKTLESIDFEYAPTAIYLNKDKTILITTFAIGEKLNWIRDAPKEDRIKAIDIILDALIKLKGASFSICDEYYYNLTNKKLETYTVKKNVNTYLTKWLEDAKRADPDPEFIAWIEPKIEQYEKYAENALSGKNITLNHGDSTEGNIFLTKKFELTLIDWDSSSFSQYPEGWDDFGLAYLFIHVELFQNNKDYVISKVSLITGISEQSIIDAISYKNELISIGDVMWAIMMHARAKIGTVDKDPKVYFDIANTRIKNFEESFKLKSFLNS